MEVVNHEVLFLADQRGHFVHGPSKDFAGHERRAVITAFNGTLLVTRSTAQSLCQCVRALDGHFAGGAA